MVGVGVGVGVVVCPLQLHTRQRILWRNCAESEDGDSVTVHCTHTKGYTLHNCTVSTFPLSLVAGYNCLGSV
jgi:hypothetical protein